MIAMILGLLAQPYQVQVGERHIPPPIVEISSRRHPPTPAEAMAHGVVRLHPSEAILKAADAAPGAITAVFDLPVRATGVDRGIHYLNSENDYRDQRNLTIAIGPGALAPLQKRFGEDLAGLKSKRILVFGQAKRIRIEFTNFGQPSGKYYYQTHVLIGDPNQLSVVGQN